jgi:COMPASS component SPP1
MKTNIDTWAKNGGDKNKLWESVKHAERREGVVVCADNGGTKKTMTKASKARVERDVERLNGQLDEVMQEREKMKKELDVVLWRARLVELAADRSDKVDECAWDQRLCFGDEEYAEFGNEVLASYDEKEDEDAMQVDITGTEEGEWWCRGKKKCERHAG